MIMYDFDFKVKAMMRSNEMTIQNSPVSWFFEVFSGSLNFYILFKINGNFFHYLLCYLEAIYSVKSIKKAAFHCG